MDTAEVIAQLQAVLDRLGGEREPARPMSDAQIEAENRLESLAEDRQFFGRWGGTDADADRAALVEEDRAVRAVERFWR